MIDGWNRRMTVGGLSALWLGTGTAGAQDKATARPASREIVRQLAPSGTLRAAINTGNVVLARKGGVQGATGASVDIANELGRRLGVPVELIVYDAAGAVVQRLDADRWDIAFMGRDPARADQIAFTAPYVYIEGTYLVRDDAPYRSVADIDRTGVRIAVGQGAAYDLFLTRALKQATLVREPTSVAAIAAFVRDRLETVAGVRQALVDFQHSTPGYRVLADSFNRIDQAVAIPKGREAGLAYVAAMMEQLKASGFVRMSLDRAGQTGAAVAPAA